MTRPATVAVIGTGVIGGGWTALCLAHGIDVRAHDPAPGAEERLRAAVDAARPALARLHPTDPDHGTPNGRLTFTSTVADAVENSDYVQENGPETAELKAALIDEIDQATPGTVPIASSSSGHMPSRLQDMARRHPERVLVGHPFHPTHLIPLVEVVPGRLSTQQTVDSALSFYASLGKRPILVRHEVPGHVTNRLQAALWQEAYALIERGVATVADIDTAISNGPGLRWALLGPITNQHLSGGPGGLAHTLAHLGPPAQEWMDDLTPTRLTPALAQLLVDGLHAALAGTDHTTLAARRDELLIDLITRKRQHPTLP